MQSRLDQSPGISKRLPRTSAVKLRLDDFELGEVLGNGTVGTIYDAQDRKTGERVALKRLLPNLSSDPLISARFEREMHILEQLDHPHIVHYFGGGQQDGQLFFVMERVDGGSLKGVLRRDSVLTWWEAATIGRQLASALQHGHNHGIIHRDVKPSNLLLTAAGEIKLSDFGIARDTFSADLTDVGLTVGSHAYMSPEQITGERTLTGATDLYSLGCLLFELLAGHPPFTGANFAQLFEQHLHKEPPSLIELGVDCPPELERLVQQLLAKSPQQRPFNARAVQAELMKIAQATTDAECKPSQPDVAATSVVEPDGMAQPSLFERGTHRLRERVAISRATPSREVSWLRLAVVLLGTALLVVALAWAAQ